jgi:hypothetical protein
MPPDEYQKPAANHTEDARNLDNRRDFLRKFGTSLGGVTLIGGGGSNLLLGQTALPSGYRFYRVLTTGKPLPIGPNPVKTVGAAVMLGAYEHPQKPVLSDVLYFHGTPTQQARAGEPQALFRGELNYNAGTGAPTLTQVSIEVAQGDALNNVAGIPNNELPIVVGTLGIGCANSSAAYATTISVNDYGNQGTDGSVQAKSAPGVYLYNPFSRTWTKIARLGDDSPDGGQYGGFFGDVKLNEDGTVLFAAATTAPPSPPAVTGFARRSRVPWYVGSHALVQSVPGSPLDSSIILRTGDMLPGTAAVIEGFGLIDAVNGEHYVAQVNARRLDILSALSGTAVVRGRLRPARSLESAPDVDLLSGSTRLLPNGVPRTLDTLVGESIIGPRIGFRGLTALVTHDALTVPGAGSFDLQRLSTWGRLGRKLILRAGDVGANTASALGAPVVSSESGITFVAEPLADGSTRLLVSNGNETKVILKSGDLIEGFQVTEIHHGYHPAQVDYKGRLAFATEVVAPGSDPDNPINIATCVVIGIPV